MNIVFVTSHLTVITGASKFVSEYVNKFNEHGHNVTIVAQKIDLNNYKIHHDISLIEIGGPLPSTPLHWLLFNVVKNKYLRALKVLQGDLVVSIGFPSNFFCSLVSKQNGIKHVYYCLDPFRYFYDRKFYSTAPLVNRIIYQTLRLFYKKYDIKGTLWADDIVCISNFTRQNIKKIYVRDSKVHHIGIATDNSLSQKSDFIFRQELAINDINAPIIFALGLTHHLKGERELMVIFRKIVEKIPNAVLLIGGWKTKRNEKIMRNLAKKLLIPQENIIFCGFIEQYRLDCIYQNSNITVYTAINESYGYIPLESMKNGTPVVAFEGGPSDTIIDGQTGYTIKNVNLNDFAQKSIKLLQDKILRRRFSENAKQHVKTNFNLEKSFLVLENIFRETIAKKPS